MRAPKRGRKRHNLSSAIKHRISSFAAEQSEQHVSSFSNEQVHSKPSRSQAVSAKLEDGNVRAALRILLSDDCPAAPLPQSFQAMQEKHLPASVALPDLPRPNVQQSVSVDEATVRQTVLSFPAGSSGGPDGLRPQHIRDLIMCREAGIDLLCASVAA